MADKSTAEQNALRVVEWLVDNRTEFEQQGIGEDRLAPAVSLTKEEIAQAVDHLENREEVVRMPPQFVLKPGRIWPETRDEICGRRSSA